MNVQISYAPIQKFKFPNKAHRGIFYRSHFFFIEIVQYMFQFKNCHIEIRINKILDVFLISFVKSFVNREIVNIEFF